YAPMSQAASALRETPRWSVAPTQVAASPALRAGLENSSAWVKLGPPLSARARMPASLLPTKMSFAAPFTPTEAPVDLGQSVPPPEVWLGPMMLWPRLVTVPFEAVIAQFRATPLFVLPARM